MKRLLFVKTYLLFSFVICQVLLCATSAFAISAKNLFHNPPDARTFKSAGLPLTLKAVLNGTRNVNNKVKLVAVIDGKAIDVASNQVYWYEYDRPVYDFDIFYPKKTLSYVFVMDEYGDSLRASKSVSKRYSVKRLCDFSTSSDSTEKLQQTFDDANIEERKEMVMDEIFKLLKWFDERVSRNESN